MGCLGYLSLVALFSSGIHGYKSISSLLCYSDQSGPRYQICDNSFGSQSQTCFTKYDDKNEIMLRGCSSKPKVFYTECETYRSGTMSEKFCFCSYDLCNKDGIRHYSIEEHINLIMTIMETALLFFWL